ncbi:ParB/RepB/Spo0J family partition protein [Streptomyces cacaoi]|uniref:ParB/RepB/Spo0J family partition protein n=1 Tax=Streptomyces cacaoi TaxID=1898 RepID=UPI0011F35B99|nr:hypothetical protein [Streptomyces cacaoi]
MPRKGPGTRRGGDPRGGESGGGGGGLGTRGSFSVEEGQRFRLDLGTLAFNPRNLREAWEFETQEFEEFSANVENVGQAQDPVVASVSAFCTEYPESTFPEHVHWVLLYGERRVRAALNRGEEEMPAVRRDQQVAMGDLGMLSENNWRKNFDPIQEGIIYQRLRDEKGLSYAQILEALGGAKAADRRITDMSKRVKLAQFAQGRFRRAVKAGVIRPNPAYELLTKLKDKGPEALDEACRLMHEEGKTWQEAVQVLAPDRLPDPKSKALQKSDEASEDPKPPHVPSTRDSEDQSTGNGEDQSSGNGEDRSSGNSNGGNDRTNHEFPRAERHEAAKRVLATRIQDDSCSQRALRYGAALAAVADEALRDLAEGLLPTDMKDRSAVARLLRDGGPSGDSPSVLAWAAEALTLAVGEREVRAAEESRSWGHRAAEHLAVLTREGGYEPGPYETVPRQPVS